MSQKEDLLGAADAGADGEEDTKGAGAGGSDDSDDDLEKKVAALAKDPEGIKKLLLHKRKLNDEDKGYRTKANEYKQKLDAITAERQKEKEEAERAKLTEQERLQADIKKLQDERDQEKNALSQARFDSLVLSAENEALRLGYQDDTDVLEVKLKKHIDGLSDEDRAAFGKTEAKAWVADFKKANAKRFQAAQAGSTRPTPPGGAKPKDDDAGDEGDLPNNLRRPKNAKDRAALDRRVKEKLRL